MSKVADQNARNRSDKVSEVLRTTEARNLIKQRFYQWALDSADGNAKRIGWDDVALALETETGVSIPSETLRQNFHPANREKGRAPRQFKDLKRWRAIYDFLISDVVGFLRPIELERLPAPIVTAMIWNDFMGANNRDPSTALLRRFIGRFSNQWLADVPDGQILTLDINVSSETGAALVNGYEEKDELESEPFGPITYSGFLVSTASGFAIFVLRDPLQGTPKLLTLLQTHPSFNETADIMDIALFEYRGLVDAVIEKQTSLDPDLRDPSTFLSYALAGASASSNLFLTRC